MEKREKKAADTTTTAKMNAQLVRKWAEAQCGFPRYYELMK